MSTAKSKNRVYPKRLTSLSGIGDLHVKRNVRSSGIDSFIINNIKQADGSPTDAYGEIEFGSDTSNTAKYIKVSHTTSVEIIYQLMTKHWNLKTPNLIISVTGGAKNFMLRTRLKEVFRRSLIKASESTGAWITTGGTRTGVMKHVGKAVAQYAAVKDDEKRVVTVGVVPWGVIHKRNLLNNHQRPDQSVPKIYDAEEGQQGSGALLDHNHSHFILVDNGKEDHRNSVNEIYGSEIDLRTKLEGHISRQRTSDHVNVMTVCVIVQGGPGSLKTVEGSIKNSTPVVIVEGSGGWADILATAYAMEVRDLNVDSLKDLLNEASVRVEKDKLEDWLDMVLVCLKNKHLLTVFSLDPTDSSRDLDIAILEALLKANSGDDAQSYQQLKLAIAWNRSDIAQSHILTDDVWIKKRDIAKLFYNALKDNKHKFCKVFLDYGVDLKEYFTVKDLKSLYESAPKHLVFYKKLAKRQFSLQGVGELLLEYLGQSYINVYKNRHSRSTKYCAIVKQQESTEEQSTRDWSPKCKLDDPYREIFQWAILFNYREIAKHVWECMFGATQAAIMANRMLKVLASQMGRDQEKKLTMEADADEYEMLATGIFANCFLQSPSNSFNLLIVRLPKWGGYTCLHVAIEADDKRFVSSPGVQKFFDDIWTSKLSHNHSLHLIAAGFLLFPIFTTVNFEEKEDDETDSSSSAIENGNRNKGLNKMELKPVERKDDEENNMGITTSTNANANLNKSDILKFNNPNVDLSKPQDYTLLQKLVIFYDAPVVTFWLNVVSFLLYLVLFAYVVMSDFQLGQVFVSGWEYLLLIWISTFLMEEIREMVNQEARFPREKFRLHVTQPWNVMDLSSLVLFYVGFGLRYNVAYLYEALILYALAFMIQCIRLVHIFAVHPVLGPKIIMVGKMLKDLLFFLFILIVFLVAYGVASQALLYPGETNFVTILVGIIYRPYWQIYGELFLDEINYNPNLSEGFECNQDGTNANLPRCPVSSPIVPIISAFYLLFANVLLLNLLIAMFSYTFEKVESQNKEIWMFQRYHLITDYYFRPPFVPPLIIISHVYLIFSYFRRKLSNRMELDDPFRRTLKIDLDGDGWKALRQWEHWHADAFVRGKRQEDENKVDRQLVKLNQRIDSISTTMEDLEGRIQKQSGNKGLNKLISRKFAELESLLGGHGALSTSKNRPKTPAKPVAEVKPPETEKKSPPSRQKSAKEERVDSPVHVKARCKVYPTSKVKKAVVPDDKVLWKVEWNKYNPPSFTHPSVAANPPWADEDLEKLEVHLRPKLPFNKYDQNEKVMRKSHTGNYLVEEGIPKNPKGRTGIKGRGLLGRYGPNHAADPVVTRWKRMDNGDICKIENKPVLEFVAIHRTDTNEWAIPGGMVSPGEHVSATLKREFGEEALSIEGLDEVERSNIGELFKSGGLELFRGYCDDHRNTDNAWIETVACNFHDEVGDAFNHVKFSPQDGEARAVAWIEVTHNLKLYASHYDYLQKAAEMHNAYF